MLKCTVYLVIRFLLFFLCKVDRQSLKAVPPNGPMILVGNHINFLDAPLAATFLFPRKMMSLVKEETFDHPILRFLFRIWGSIPVKRGSADFRALTKAVNVLEDGMFFAIFPEGTRSGDGRLIKGHPGVVLVALKSNAPILPVVHYGTELFQQNLRKFRRTRVTFKIGEPFFIKQGRSYSGREERQLITDEIMYQLAKLLPEKNRGYYADLGKATTHYLNFDVQNEKSPGSVLTTETER